MESNIKYRLWGSFLTGRILAGLLYRSSHMTAPERASPAVVAYSMQIFGAACNANRWGNANLWGWGAMRWKGMRSPTLPDTLVPGYNEPPYTGYWLYWMLVEAAGSHYQIVTGYTGFTTLPQCRDLLSYK